MTIYSVLDKFGERLWSSTRERCKEFIKTNQIEDAILVRRKPVTYDLPEADILPEQEVKVPETAQEVAKTARYVARHICGGVVAFRSLEAVAIYFGVAQKSVHKAIARGIHMQSGRMKDWQIEILKKDKGV